MTTKSQGRAEPARIDGTRQPKQQPIQQNFVHVNRPWVSKSTLGTPPIFDQLQSLQRVQEPLPPMEAWLLRDITEDPYHAIWQVTLDTRPHNLTSANDGAKDRTAATHGGSETPKSS